MDSWYCNVAVVGVHSTQQRRQRFFVCSLERRLVDYRTAQLSHLEEEEEEEAGVDEIMLDRHRC
jgi:hypothetical protein